MYKTWNQLIVVAVHHIRRWNKQANSQNYCPICRNILILNLTQVAFWEKSIFFSNVFCKYFEFKAETFKGSKGPTQYPTYEVAEFMLCWWTDGWTECILQGTPYSRPKLYFRCVVNESKDMDKGTCILLKHITGLIRKITLTCIIHSSLYMHKPSSAMLGLNSSLRR